MVEQENSISELPDVSDLELCIVENNATTQEFVELIISKLHAGKFKTMHRFSKGADAIEQYRKAPYDILMTDTMDAGLNIIDLLKELRPIVSKHLGVIAFTGEHCEEGYAEQFYNQSSTFLIPHIIYRQGVIIPELFEAMGSLITYLRFRKRIFAGNI